MSGLLDAANLTTDLLSHLHIYTKYLYLDKEKILNTVGMIYKFTKTNKSFSCIFYLSLSMSEEPPLSGVQC